MPGIDDELHHIGCNACSSCYHDATKERRYLIVPGVRSTANDTPFSVGHSDAEKGADPR
jgi:hypothetical protein